jgi:hypothetical protein
VTYTATMVMSGNTVTVTLTSNASNTGVGIGSTTLKWTPSGTATDLAGNAASTTQASESGGPKQNY